MTNETVREICDLVRIPRLDLFKTYKELADRILAAHEREMAAKDEEIARLRHILKSACRWIHCHDIYHTSGDEILKEAKETLDDDGEFIFKKGETK